MNQSANNKNFISRNGNNIIVIIILAILVLLLVEQAIRFHVFGYDSFSYKKMHSIKSLGHSGFIQASDVKSIVYELKPNIDSQLKLVDFKTNSKGLRDMEYSIRKPDDTFRVVIIGASFTFGSGIEIEDTFHSLLEDRLNEESEDLKYEFISFGVGGYTMRNKLATLKFKALEYDPDLVLFILDGSEFTDDEYRDFVPKPTKNHFFKSYTYKLLKRIKIFGPRDTKTPKFLKHHYEHLDELDRKFHILNDISQKYGTPICVVVLDHDYLHYELSKKILALAEKNGLYSANTLPSFTGTSFRDFRIYKVDFHPNTEANSMFAHSIYKELKNQSLLEK